MDTTPVRRIGRLRGALAAGLLLVSVPPLLGWQATRAAEPAGGTLDEPGEVVTWTGPEQGPGTSIVGPETDEPCPADGSTGCDHFTLVVDPPTTGSAVTITVTAPPTDDYDLYVYGPDGARVGESGLPNGFDEVVDLPGGSVGTFEIRVAPYTTTPGSRYTGRAQLSAPVEADGDVDPAPGGRFEQLTGFATKTGFRGVFAWSASEPVAGQVLLGTAPDRLGEIAVPAPGPPDTAQLAVVDGLEPGARYYWAVEDLLTGERSNVGSISATNAYTAWDGAAYTIDLLVQLDAESLPPDIPADQALVEIAAGVNVLAERIYDALDGHARIGDVLITDTNVDYAANLPGVLPVRFGAADPCTGANNLADVLVTTAMPFDSHTFGWAIESPCIPFYVGRLGQLVVPWEDDLHFGYTATHELMHYAFGAPDLYPGSPQGTLSGADCRNLEWDGSLMHNTGGWVGTRWELTELDRSPELTPCTHGEDVPYTWDVLRTKYTAVPGDVAPEHVVDVLPRGNPDGGALRIHVLDRSPASSTLVEVEPSDESFEPSPPVCAAGNPVLVDAEGDASIVGEPSVDTLDLRAVVPVWDAGTSTMVVTAHLTALREPTDPPAPGAVGEVYDIGFTIGDGTFYVRGERTGPLDATYVLRRSGGGTAGATDETLAPIEGEVVPADAVIRFFVPADGSGTEIGLVEGATVTGWRASAWRDEGAVLLRADDATGSCPFTAATAGRQDPKGPKEPKGPKDPKGPKGRD